MQRPTPSQQSVHQADGSIPLAVVGETRMSFTLDNRGFSFEDLVVENLDVDIFAGTPFMEFNELSVRPAELRTLGDATAYIYGCQIHKQSQKQLPVVPWAYAPRLPQPVSSEQTSAVPNFLGYHVK